jgi:hypothetical protein
MEGNNARGVFMNFVKLFYVFRKIGTVFVLSGRNLKVFYEMKKATRQSVRWLSAVILFFATISVIVTYWSVISRLFASPGAEHIVWIPGRIAWQVFVFGSWIVGASLLYAFCWIFLLRINRSLASGEAFPKANISLIRWAALVSVFTTMADANFSAAYSGDPTSTLSFSTFFVPVIVLLFAELYKIAHLSELDSRLAI